MAEEEKTGKRVNFETKIEVLRGGNVDYGRYPAVSLRRQDWTSTSFGSYLGCLFGLAVECATARLSTRTGLIS